MSVRRNRITGDPILLAPQRARRPGAFGGADEGRCPFCPGNEAETPPTILTIGEPWRVRVFANKYPPVEGAEVIVESPQHDARFESLAHATECVTTWQRRLAAHSSAAYVALFRNEGTSAGASIAHIHSQLVPLPFLPLRAAREIDGFNGAAVCPLCQGGEDEMINETTGFRWVAPSDSWAPYQQRIIPTRHVATFGALTPRELDDLAALLRDVARATRRVSASYNWTFHEFRGVAAAHFYIDVIPRATTIAGLELGTGTFVEIIDPALAARALRD